MIRLTQIWHWIKSKWWMNWFCTYLNLYETRSMSIASWIPHLYISRGKVFSGFISFTIIPHIAYGLQIFGFYPCWLSNSYIILLSYNTHKWHQKLLRRNQLHLGANMWNCSIYNVVPQRMCWPLTQETNTIDKAKFQ